MVCLSWKIDVILIRVELSFKIVRLVKNKLFRVKKYKNLTFAQKKKFTDLVSLFSKNFTIK